jgi:hypothetical protein
MGKETKPKPKPNSCKAGIYTTNEVVTHGPLMCFGGYGQPQCNYIRDCIEELSKQGIKFRKSVLKTIESSPEVVKNGNEAEGNQPIQE